LVHKLGPLESGPSEWRLFIDASKRCLKGVFLRNWNVFGSVPVSHSKILKASYENLEILLSRITFQKYNWQVCGDLKIVSMLLPEQSGYTKYTCFMYEWHSIAHDLVTGSRKTGRLETIWSSVQKYCTAKSFRSL
jgi:hypothetical protein